MNKLPQVPKPGMMLRVKKSSRKRGYPDETALIVSVENYGSGLVGDHGNPEVTIMHDERFYTAPWAQLVGHWSRNWELAK